MVLFGIFVLAGRIPELYFAALGTLKNGSVFCPLFSAFGPEPVRQRLERGDACILVTTRRQYEKKVAGLIDFNKITSSIEPGDTTLLFINRGGRRFYITIKGS